jgi:serine/threonine protein kinase
LKGCPTCQRLYEPEAGFCPIDGARLAPVEELPLPSDPEDSRIGSRACGGRYEIRRKVADGGMGRVYQARDVTGDRNVALKILHNEVAGDAVAVERFRREYQLSAELPHEHIVEVLDFEETGDDTYALVMEYLEGEELRMLLKRDKTVPPARLVRLLSQLAIGLAEPHQRKIVHRDIKPDNIFLCHTSEGPLVKLLDFGSVRDNAEGAKKLTVVGTTIGSPFYMAPEQAQGLAELDHRADVWSLAAIVYESLTGTVPFPGKTGPQILLAILGQEPQPASFVAEGQVPSGVDQVFSEALAKDMTARIGSVAELANRFGHAYGLEGDHLAWAKMPEQDLAQMIDERLPALMAAAPEAPPKAAEPEKNSFDDEDFAMGVPDQAPTGLYIGLGLGAVVLIAGAVAFLLL